MAEKATDSGGKYYVFYYDVERGVELAARLPDEQHQKTSDGRSIHFQIRAKIVNGDEVPYVAHYNCFKSKKAFRFALDENAEHRFGKNGNSIRLPNRLGSNVTCKPASQTMRTTMQESMEEITRFNPKNRSKILNRTPELLSNRQKYQQREITKIRTERAQEQGASFPKTQIRQEQQRISAAAKDIKPRVFVLTPNGLVSRYLYEDYIKHHYSKKEAKTGQQRRERALQTDAATQMHNAMLSSSKGRAVRAPYSLDDDDVNWDASPIKRKKGDKTFRYTCADALLVKVKIKGETIERKADHTLLEFSNSKVNHNGFDAATKKAIYAQQNPLYEVWVLDKENTPETPHFHVIRYSNSKKEKIASAARFQFSRDDETGKVTAIPWPYNEHELGANPITHPSHNMYVNDDPVHYHQAQEVASLFAEDAIAAWKKHFNEQLKNNNMLAGTPSETHISDAVLYGHIRAHSNGPDIPK